MLSILCMDGNDIPMGLQMIGYAHNMNILDCALENYIYYGSVVRFHILIDNAVNLKILVRKLKISITQPINRMSINSLEYSHALNINLLSQNTTPLSNIYILDAQLVIYTASGPN